MNATMSPSLTMRMPTTCAVNVIGRRRGRGGSDGQESLMKFATENLGPVCSPGNIDVCDDAQKKLIAKYQAMDADALTKLIDGKEKELADAEKAFSDAVSELQATYEKLSKEKDETKEKINDDDFKFAKAVKKAAAKASATDEL
jgi:Skp family chaperone for outer membrane proteins